MNPSNSGISLRTNEHGISVLRLHYECDPAKGGGEKVFVPEINRWLSPWALAEYQKMTDSAMYLQEYEIDSEARLGTLVFHLKEEATVEDAFPIPPNWTREMALDPHPAVPHAFLWRTIDPWGDRWYYRELWPSKVCFRRQGGQLLGKAGPCPQDDNRYTIAEYVKTIAWLESEENPENAEKPEKITKRVIDYAARAFGQGTTDDREKQPNFQLRYETAMREAGLVRPWFDDAKKDHQVGIETVNQGLKPREVMGNDGKYHPKSKIHIFRDCCPELIYQLKNNRFTQLTPTQIEKMDPTGKPIEVRRHCTDCLRYLEMEPATFMLPARGSDTSPMEPGFSY